MKKYNLFIKALTLLLILAVSFSFCSCAAQKKTIVKKPKASQEEKEPPKELEDMKKSIEKIEKTLQSLHESSKKPLILLQQEVQEKEKKEGGDKEKEKKEEEGNNTGGEDKKKSDQPPTAEEVRLKMEQELFKTMEDTKKDVMELHSTWNTYEPKAVADLAMQTSITSFEEALNNLTKSINDREVFPSLVNANQAYKNLPDFYMLYKAKTPPEIDRVRYAVKQIKLSSEVKDFATVNDAMSYLDNIWIITKPKLKKNNIEVMNQFEFALADLKAAVESQNVMVITAKADVILKIADEMEKAAEKQSD